MRLERALVTGAGGVPLPAPETVSWLVVVICLRWMSRLRGIHPKRGRGSLELQGGQRLALPPRLQGIHWHEVRRAHAGGCRRSAGSGHG